MPKISLIVNTVDRPDDLKRCLTAIFRQTYKDYEVVVVNNGLGRETKKVLTDFKVEAKRRGLAVKIIEDKTKKLSYLFNLGWRQANPDSVYLAYLADDTEADADWLATAVDYLDKNPSCGAVSGPTLATTSPPGEMFYLRDKAQKNIFTRLFLRIYEYLVMEDRTLEPGFWPQSGAFTMGAGIPLPRLTEPTEVDLLTSGNMVVARPALEAVGGFDENFLFNHADGDLFIRLKKLGYELIFHPEVKVLHHMRQGPTRYPWILGRDTAFYYLKDVRPKSLRGWLGAFLNLIVFNGYFVFKAGQTKNFNHLRGNLGFLQGIFDFFKTATEERKEMLSKLAVGLGFIFLFYLVHRRVGDWGMLAYGDTTPFPESFSQAFRFFFKGFDPRSPQITMPQASVVLSTLVPLEALLAALFGGGPAGFIWAQRIYHFLPIPLSFITIYYFASQFATSRLARFLTALIYSGNHFMVAEFAGGFEGNLYIPALFPVLVLLLHRIYQLTSQPDPKKLSNQPSQGSTLRGQSGRGLRRLVLQYSVILTVAFVLSDHVLFLLLPLWLVFLLAPIWEKSLDRARLFFKSLGVLAVSFLVLFFLSVYHTVNYFKIALPFLSGQGLPADLIPFFVTNIWDTYWRMTWGNVLRLGGSYFSDFFGGSDAWARLGFVIPLLAFSWFFFKENRSGARRKIGWLFSCLSLATIIFIFLTSRGITIPVFKSLPFLFRFRNPSRFSLFLAFLYAPLIAFTLDSWFRRLGGLFDRKRYLSFSSLGLISLLVVSLLLFYLKGFFSGDLTMSKNRVDNFWIKDRYYQISDFIASEQKKNGPFRTAYFPWNHEEAEVKLFWLDPYALGVPIEYGAYVQNEYLEFLKEAYQAVEKERNDLASLLARGGVKYVVLNSWTTESGRALYRYDYHVPWLLGSSDDIRRIISASSGLDYRAEIAGFEIFENRLYDARKVNLEQAGLDAGGGRTDRTRVFLISLTFISWLVFGLAYLRAKNP